MRYLSTKEIANRWNITERTVRNYCSQGLIPGAFVTGKTWNIPEDAIKPVKKRGKKAAPEKPVKEKASKAKETNSTISPLLNRLKQEKDSQTKGGIYHRVQIELTYNSNHIESSKLSLDQTRYIFETATVGLTDTAVPVDDIIETNNHFRAFDYVIDHACEPITETIIKNLHYILKSSTTDAAKSWFAVGDYKKLPNEVGMHATTDPEKVPAEIAQLLASYRPEAAHTFEDILDFHVQFERIHPFQDSNGRVGRLLMFKECLASDIVPFIITDDMKLFYYRGLSEWNNEKGYLADTCLAAQDAFKKTLKYFRIAY